MQLQMVNGQQEMAQWRAARRWVWGSRCLYNTDRSLFWLIKISPVNLVFVDFYKERAGGVGGTTGASAIGNATNSS